MKLSQTDLKELLQLSDQQISEIVFEKSADDGLSGEVAILLGGSYDRCRIRAEAAAKLYFDGRVKYVLPTGGVEWDFDGESVTEALYMTRRLKELGVPEEAIIIENNARTTKENMICATLKLDRTIRLENIHRVYIVTNDWHMRRSLALAKWLLPRSFKISGYSVTELEILRDNWFKTEKGQTRIRAEAKLMKGLIDNGLIDDIEY